MRKKGRKEERMLGCMDDAERQIWEGGMEGWGGEEERSNIEDAWEHFAEGSWAAAEVRGG
jgi:hypothetical protein